MPSAIGRTARAGTIQKPPRERSGDCFFLARDPRNKPLPAHPNARRGPICLAVSEGNILLPLQFLAYYSVVVSLVVMRARRRDRRRMADVSGNRPMK
jgi:hypothetical protein